MRILILVLALLSSVPVAQDRPGPDIFLVDFGPGIASGQVRNATLRSGYDNQPHFLPDSRSFLYTAQVDGQADIYRIEVASGRRTQVTRTPESEYSPCVRPGGAAFTVIRVEGDGRQRLWEFDMDGSNPRLVFEDLEPVGYQAWSGREAVALFILGKPPTLQLGRPNQKPQLLATAIGRSIQTSPGGMRISFISREEPHSPMIMEWDPSTDRQQQLAPVLEGSRDFAWTPNGRLVMGKDSRLFVRNLAGSEWEELIDLSNLEVEDISRLTISPDGRYVALVARGVP